MSTSRAMAMPGVSDAHATQGHDVLMAGMHKAQHMAMGHGHLHLPSKGTVITVVIVLHVVAMSYLLYAMYTAHRRAAPREKAREPPRRVNCVYEWSSLGLPPPASALRMPQLGITRA